MEFALCRGAAANRDTTHINREKQRPLWPHQGLWFTWQSLLMFGPRGFAFAGEPLDTFMGMGVNSKYGNG